MKAFSAQEIHSHPDRLKYPMKRKTWSVDEPHTENRGKDEWERITWDEALDLIEAKMRKIIDEYGPESVIISQGTGRGSNHFLDRLNNSWNGGGKVWPTHVCLLPNLLNLAFYGWSSDAAYLREYAARILKKRRGRP